MNAAAAASRHGLDRVGIDPPVRYIRSHAALRGVAAMLVVMYHLQLATPYRLAIETATPFFQRCYLLVDLFFILSGFVISLTSDADRSRTPDGREVRDFYVARIARLYPLHIFCLCAAALLLTALSGARQWHHGGGPLALYDPATATSFVAEALLVQAWIPGAPYWNIPSWSISAEMVAYLLFPLVLAMRDRLARAATPLMLLLPVIFYGSMLAGSRSLDVLTGIAVLRCLSGFTIGILLYDARHRVASWSDRAIALAQGAAIVGAVAVLASDSADPLAIPFFALLVVTTWQDRGPVARLLDRPFPLRAGELSYSIYLTHAGLIALIHPIWYQTDVRLRLGVNEGRTLEILTSVGATWFVARWTYQYVETPSRRRMKALLTYAGRGVRPRISWASPLIAIIGSAVERAVVEIGKVGR